MLFYVVLFISFLILKFYIFKNENENKICEVPRKGLFYEHDDRLTDESCSLNENSNRLVSKKLKLYI